MRAPVDEVPNGPVKAKVAVNGTSTEQADIDLRDYKPEVSKETGEWFISETDLEFISEGCGVLGTGGGGTTYGTLLHSVDVLRKLPKGRMRVIDPSVLRPKSHIVSLPLQGPAKVSF